MNEFSEPKQSAAAALKHWMEETKTTVKQLSAATGISERTITALRSGRSAGNFATWRIICRRTGLNIEEIMGL